MISKTAHRIHPFARILSLAVVIAIGADEFSVSHAADRNVNHDVNEILARQKKKPEAVRKELHVYLRDAKRIYVNGKQISIKTLTSVARKSGTDLAVISVEPVVVRDRVNEIRSIIQRAGLKRIKFTTPERQANERQKKQEAEQEKERKSTAAAVKAKAQQEVAQANAKAQIQVILERQKDKGKALGIYLKNATGIYVNGTQISLVTLTKVVRLTHSREASISAERRVPHERVKQVLDTLSKNGVKSVDLKSLK